MNPKYVDGIESHLNDIVVVHRIDIVEYGDAGGGSYTIDRGNVLAKVVDLHPENKKCFELKYLEKNKNETFRTNKCKLADFRDLKEVK